ncbi:uncharacterized protein si:ch73-341k19.1 isoform X2 [Carassius carassius]|uniref:uncharacterized protein si:ch73-341k19.1 isoform X2 n=1 Tax=Carassius carassius TaxID=217509 RepID=UPI0028694B7A|nr:uncharacterized protein si:ch73-341k19.1 isoform X2 [Carassius carassius]
MSHITVKQRGQEPRPRRCHSDATLFTCPFCTTDVCKPRQYHQIMTHIAGHKLRAVEYGDHVMYSCSICCGKKTKHFHCCQCPKTYVNKGDLKQHLSSAHPIATCTPKREPVSHPLQEPPSHLQPAPHPTPEPPSQLQPASQPQELDLQQIAPPAIERKLIFMQSPSRLHITVKQRGQEPRPRRCHSDATLFTCPFCTTDVCKPRQYHQIMTHIAGHKLRAVEYGDHVMYSCSICCGKKTKHFHCCQCPKTYVNKGDLKQHLSSAHPIATCTPKPQPVSHPLQEPPSHLQPAPHPTPEPPSQLQPVPHPQELDLQQATSHPRHITVKQRGQEPRPRRCHADATLFTCPFCTTDVCKPRQYHQIMTHIAGHKLRAVEYGDHVMYSCNIGCGKRAKHFHCYKCPKTYINKSDLKRHLCSAHPMAPETQPVGRPLQGPSLQQPAPCSLKLAAHPVMAKRKQISVQCPHCGLSLNSKNLKKHIERKHHEVLHPETSVLPAQCVDKKNGLYVVSESFSEPCTFIHVVKKFWGSSHKVMCEMDICNSRVEMAQRSELLVEQCVHLNSVDYTCDVAPSEDLSEQVLTEMVERKCIGDIRKKQCLKLQHQAESKGATFTSLVTIGGPDYMYYVSIYEPKVSHYSKMGRVLVNYNAKIKTWNCPCSKGRKPCVHRSIAKWCLYQMKKQLFKNLPETEEGIEPAQPEDLASQQYFEKWVPMTG